MNIIDAAFKGTARFISESFNNYSKREETDDSSVKSLPDFDKILESFKNDTNVVYSDEAMEDTKKKVKTSSTDGMNSKPKEKVEKKEDAKKDAKTSSTNSTNSKPTTEKTEKVEEKKEVKASSTNTSSKPKEPIEEKDTKSSTKTSSEVKALPSAGATNRLYANVFYNFVDRKSVPKMNKEVFNRIAKRVYNLFTNQGFVTAYPYMYHNGYNFVAINLESKIPAFELCSVHTLPNGKKYMKVILFTEDEDNNNIFPDSTTWFTVNKENEIVKENVPYGGMTPCDIYYSVMGVKDNIEPALSVNESATA